ncbi:MULTISPECIES: hypothetical protein [unclassified Chelatococcus]|uniref:hypothetical protein n=1 Tax=unclassified Chelatococcus TaxID=2638111 RepID=UPI001BCB9FCA|nr:MULTISPECIES: hypothetical protein [unclassified Chelatococcus]MBS7737794.1 hypothetical protein [Chelatococcus sp. HY11]MCO5079250.1 hypothetical protein [Chelatococcus sp.]CAH1665923.1 conserved exported hypothetical protein [Hyphomicrobiales bacterium]CAH1681016.1 conserved exported hypothetical protein [Hyphomicrobiales bacterium]
MKRALLAAAVIAAATSAHADWLFQGGEDPLDDQKIGFILTVQEKTPRPFIIGFKCWQGEKDETLLILTTPLPHNAGGAYKDEVDVVVRVDKGEKRDVSLNLIDVDGKIAFRVSAEREPVIHEIIKEVGAAKNRIVVGIADQIITFPAKGSANAVRKFNTTCEDTKKPAT